MYQLLSLPSLAIVLLCPAPIWTANVCNTELCNRTALTMSSYMDLKADPCDDFYQFACGDYLKVRIPNHTFAKYVSDVVAARINKEMKRRVERSISKKDPKPFALVKTFYKNCMDTKRIHDIGLSEMHQIIEEVGGWPVLQGSQYQEHESVSWEETVYKLTQSGFLISNVLMNFYIDYDRKNSSKKSLYLDQPTNTLFREAPKEQVKAYYEYMVDVAIAFGAKNSSARLELLEVLNFEMELSAIAIPAEDQRDHESMYNPMTTEDLKNHTSFDWQNYMNKVFSPHLKIENHEEIIVAFPNYWQKFSLLMQKTPKRTVINYLLWKTVSGSITYLTDTLRKRQLQFKSLLSGVTAVPKRWQHCVQLCSNSLNIAASAMHIQMHYNKSVEANVRRLLTNIRSGFHQSLKKKKWIDKETKQQALEKLNLLFPHIGPPNELKDHDKLTKAYEGLELNGTSFLKSMLRINLFNMGMDLKEYRLPINKTNWLDHSDSLTVDAFYKFLENSIVIPSSILREPMYNSDYPQYINYGHLGFLIGHELTHAFDDQGKQFDKNGNLFNWWTNNTSKAFQSKAQCFIKQYSNFSVPEVKLKVNGLGTQGENIADNGGLRHAYWAYVKTLEEDGENPQLPGLNYNNRQMFWLSAAQSWCAKFRPRQLRMFVLNDEHAPPKYRILGTFSNLEMFSEDFNCGKNAKMNKKNKCRIW